MMTKTDMVLEQYHKRAQEGGDFTQLERDLYECVVRNLVELVNQEEQNLRLADELIRAKRVAE